MIDWQIPSVFIIGHKDSKSNDRVALRELYDFKLVNYIYLFMSSDNNKSKERETVGKW